MLLYGCQCREDEATHQHRVHALLERLNANGLAIAIEKCQFSKPFINFLGFRVDANGILPLEKKVAAITSFPPPTKPKGLLGYLGALNYYRRCLPKVGGESPAAILQPLYAAATAKTPGKSFTKIWDENNLIEPFNKSKKMLTLACQLTHPDPTASIALVTDASAVGALEQFSGGCWRPLGLWSRHFKPNQRAWTTFRREL